MLDHFHRNRWTNSPEYAPVLSLTGRGSAIGIPFVSRFASTFRPEAETAQVVVAALGRLVADALAANHGKNPASASGLDTIRKVR